MKNVATEWIIEDVAADSQLQIEKALSLPPALARTLIVRGWDTPGGARALLDPSLDLDAIDLDDALFQEARSHFLKPEAPSNWILFADPDADGILATWLLSVLLDQLGLDWTLHFPTTADRQSESRQLWEGCQTSDAGIICLDRGANDTWLANRCREDNRPLLVIDHHLNEDSRQSHCIDTTSTTLAWKLMLALRDDAHLSPPVLESYLSAVAISLVADRALMTGKNRKLLFEGFQQLQVSSHLGLLILQKLGARQRFGNFFFGARPITTLLNTLGKSNRGELAIQLLRTREKRILRQLADDIRHIYRRRRRHLKQGLELIQQESIPDRPGHCVHWLQHYPPDQVDLAAGWMADRRRYPIVLGVNDQDTIRCSARARSGFRLYSAFRQCQEWLLDYGGHQQAAGCRLKPENWEAFRECLEHTLAEQARSVSFQYQIDAEVELGTLDESFLRELRRLQPFGTGFPPPIFLIRHVYFHPGAKNVVLLTDKNGAQMQVALPEYLPNNKVFSGPADVLVQPTTRLSRHLPGFQLLDWK